MKIIITWQLHEDCPRGNKETEITEIAITTQNVALSYTAVGGIIFQDFAYLPILLPIWDQSFRPDSIK